MDKEVKRAERRAKIRAFFKKHRRKLIILIAVIVLVIVVSKVTMG